MFTRRLCVIGGQTDPNDWQILYNGEPIGRVHLVPVGTGFGWVWSTTTYPAMSGSSPSMEAALEDIKAAVVRVLG